MKTIPSKKKQQLSEFGGQDVNHLKMLSKQTSWFKAVVQNLTKLELMNIAKDSFTDGPSDTFFEVEIEAFSFVGAQGFVFLLLI